MPPRISSSSAVSSASARTQSTVSNASRWTPRYAVQQQQCSANFSTSSSCHSTNKTRKLFVKWVKQFGDRYEKHKPGETNYVVPRPPPGVKQSLRSNPDRPFPLNPLFKSQPVLDDQARELIWEKVMRKGETIKGVSAELGVDIMRVAAVVRLKEVEKDWIAKGKELATPYAKAVLSMLPTKSFKPNVQNEPLEHINELHIHTATMKQLFWPTSESRQFTREDAAKAFHSKMLSTDERVPHPELIQMEKDILNGVSEWEAEERFKKATEESEQKAAEAIWKREEAKELRTIRVDTRRCEFRFEKFNSENVGKDGRRVHVIGAKYGKASYDRKKGFVRIPISVP